MERERNLPEATSAAGSIDVCFALGAARVTVRAPDAGTADAVGRLFGPLVTRPDGDRYGAFLTIGRSARSWTLREADPGEDVRIRRFRALPSLLAAAEFSALGHLLARSRGETHLHASGAEVGGRAVLALGASGAGKSGLALAWSVAGRPLVSDDVVLVDEGGRVAGVPRLVKAARRLLSRSGLAEGDTVAPDRCCSALWWDPAEKGGGWSRRRLPVAVVARVRYEPRAALQVQGLDPARGLRVLLDQVMETGLSAADGLDRLGTIAETATVVDVRFGVSADAARALAALATNGAR